jgi:multidrug transporter EmrE-like cation transporter
MPLNQHRDRPNSRFDMGALWAALIVLDTSAQLLFKSAAVRLAPPELSFQWLHMVAQSLRFWAAALCLVTTFPIWMLILSRSRLGLSFAATAFTYVGVIGGSLLVFGESISSIQYAGIALIVVGVALLGKLDR